jgi:hypothetical protein
MKLKKEISKKKWEKMLTYVNLLNLWPRLLEYEQYTWKYHEVQSPTSQILKDEIEKKLIIQKNPK